MSDLLSIIKDTGDYSTQKFSKILGCSEDEIEKVKNPKNTIGMDAHFKP